MLPPLIMEPSQLFRVIKNLEVSTLREVLFNDAGGEYKKLGLLKYFSSHDEDIARTVQTDELRRLVAYALVDYENIHQDKLVIESTLSSSLRLAATTGDVVLCDVLLQAGADIFALIEDSNLTIYDSIMAGENQDIKDLLDKYFPGVWSAVESENISELRRLVNNWCSTDIYHKGVHLVDLATRGGHEPIIRLVTGVIWTMKLIRAIYAGNKIGVRELLDNQLKELHLDFRNMSEEGAPLLYYLIEREEVDITRMLVDSGCRLFTIMRLKSDPTVELPVFFAAIMNPDLSPEMLEALLPKGKHRQDELLYRLMYNGRNVLEVAVEHNLNEAAFKILVERAGARVVADRNEKCLTVRDMATEAGKSIYAQALDEFVEQSVQNPAMHYGQRQTLALFGYDFGQIAFQDPPVDTFLTQVYDYQSQIKKLGKAIEDDDRATFEQLVRWTPSKKCDSGLFEPLLCWEGRDGQENPLPMLHRAVIFGRVAIVKLILSLKPRLHSIDTLFDNQRRTALHYAYSLRQFDAVRSVLRESGCSDHTLDRANKEPLDFKDRMDGSNMNKLIERLRFADFGDPEPNAWENASDEEDESGSESGEDDDGKGDAGCVVA